MMDWVKDDLSDEGLDGGLDEWMMPRFVWIHVRVDDYTIPYF